jgi:hypothetical protein
MIVPLFALSLHAAGPVSTINLPYQASISSTAIESAVA